MSEADKIRSMLEGEESENIAQILNEALDFQTPGPEVTADAVPTEVYIELMEEPDIEFWAPQEPRHAHDDQMANVGMDFFAAMDSTWERIPDTEIYRAVVRTGVRIAMPPGLNLRLASRSGLGFKESITAFPGTIDASYRGEIKILLFSFGQPASDVVGVGTKVAQGILFRSEPYMFVPVNSVDVLPSIRGNDGFGSTD